MPREVRDNLYWIQECGTDRSNFVEETPDPNPVWYNEDEELHIGQCAYLFTDEQTLLFDTLSPASSDKIITILDELLAGDDLDYLAVSHPDVPPCREHCTNFAGVS